MEEDFYLCLVTTASYAPGAVCLGQSLNHVGSKVKLVAAATNIQAAEALRAEIEACSPQGLERFVVELWEHDLSHLPGGKHCAGEDGNVFVATHGRGSNGAVLAVDAPRRVLWPQLPLTPTSPTPGSTAAVSVSPFPCSSESQMSRRLRMMRRGFVLLDADLVALQNPDALFSLLPRATDASPEADSDVARSGQSVEPSAELWGVASFRLKKRAFGSASNNFNAGVLVVPNSLANCTMS